MRGWGSCRIYTVTVSDWLRAETPKHCKLLTDLRERLEASLDLDVNEHGTPSRDWARNYGTYQKGYQALLVEERERAKLRLLANRSGQSPLTDDEYEQEMKLLGLEAMKELPTADLASELIARGLPVPVAVDSDD